MYDLERILNKIFFLKDASYHLHDLTTKLHLVHFDENSIVFSEGEQAPCLYILLTGKVLLYTLSPQGQEKALQTLTPPDFFGETNLIDGGPSSYSAKTLDKSALYCLERTIFLDYLRNGNQALLDDFIARLGKQIRQLNIRNKILANINSKLSYSRMDQDTDIRQQTNSPDKTVTAIMELTTEANSENDGTTSSISSNPSSQTSDKKHDTENNTAQEYENESLTHKLEEYVTSFTGEGISAADYKEEPDITEMLYNKKASCPLCHTNFESPKVLSKYTQVIKIDHDFCKHHKYANPLFYEMNVCPSCGFTFNEEIMKMRIKKDLTTKLKARLTAFWGNSAVKNYCRQRSLDDALETFLLALYCVKNRPIKRSQLGMLQLKTAWLYRFKGEEAQEMEYINNTLESLAFSFEKENFTSVRSEINTAYLLGVLNMKAGRYRDSAKWLDRVLRHNSRTAFPMIVNQARDIWADVRTTLRDSEEHSKE